MCRYYRWSLQQVAGQRRECGRVQLNVQMFKCSNVRKHWRQRGGCGGRADGLLPRQSNYICNCTNRAIGNNHTMGHGPARDPKQPSPNLQSYKGHFISLEALYIFVISFIEKLQRLTFSIGIYCV